jgi:hypothetical protein
VRAIAAIGSQVAGAALLASDFGKLGKLPEGASAPLPITDIM